MRANWHVGKEDRARLRAELAALDIRLYDLDRRRREAAYRQRYSHRPQDVEQGAGDLKILVSEMDRL